MTGIGRYWKGLAVAAIAVCLLGSQLNASSPDGQSPQKDQMRYTNSAKSQTQGEAQTAPIAIHNDGVSASSKQKNSMPKGQMVPYLKSAEVNSVFKQGQYLGQNVVLGTRDAGNVGDNNIDLYSAIGDLSAVFNFSDIDNSTYADDIVTIPYSYTGEAYAVDSITIWFYPYFATNNGLVVTIYAFDDYSEVTDCDFDNPTELSLTVLGQVLINMGDDPDPTQDLIHRYVINFVDGTVTYSDEVVNGSGIVWSTLGESAIANPLVSLPLGYGDDSTTDELDNQVLLQLQAGQVSGSNFVVGNGAEIVLGDGTVQFGNEFVTADIDESGAYDCNELYIYSSTYDYTSLPISLKGSRGIDCNMNGIPDEIELAADPSLDDGTLCPGATANGVLDECECLDCNNNGIDDITDINNGTSEDCNGDYIPDECQIEGNDCNSNGIIDVCDILTGFDPDCNQNNVPDSCDLANGFADCDENLIPDTCERYVHDCNLNGIDDYCDIYSGNANDLDGDFVPDECLSMPNPKTPDVNWTEITFEADQGYVVGANIDLQPADDDNQWVSTNTNGTNDEAIVVDSTPCNTGNGLKFINLLRNDVDNDYVLTPALTAIDYDHDYDVNTDPERWYYFDQPAYQELRFDASFDRVGNVDPIFMTCQIRNLAEDDEDWIGFVGIYPNATSASTAEWFISDDDSYESTGVAALPGVCYEIKVVLDLTANGYVPADYLGKVNLTDVGRITITRKDTSEVVVDGAPFTPARPLFTDLIIWDSENDNTSGLDVTSHVDNIVVIRKGSPHPNVTDCNENGLSDLAEIAASEAGTGGSLDCNKNLILDVCEIGYCNDCDRDFVLDICQIAEDASLDLDGNGILDLCDGPIFNEPVPATMSFETSEGFAAGNVDNQNGFWVNYLMNFNSGEAFVEDATEYHDPENELYFYPWSVVSKAGTPLATDADGNNVLYLQKNLTGDGQYGTPYAGTPVMLTPGNDKSWEQWTFTMAMSQAQTQSSGAGDWAVILPTDFCNQDSAQLGILIDGTAEGYHVSSGRWKLQYLDENGDWQDFPGINATKTWTPNEAFQVRMTIQRNRSYGARTWYQFRAGTYGALENQPWRTCQYANNANLAENLDNHLRMVTRQINADQWYDDFRYYAADDCNGDGNPDVVNYDDSGTAPLDFTASPDENHDGISDYCQDCNDNGILDPDEIASTPALDCNGTGTLDSCDIEDGTSTDCDEDSVPDECQFPLATGDCDGNGKIDACDISTNGALHDTNGDGIHDLCQDCNNNNVPDPLDIAGASDDRNGDGIPDECCSNPNGADFDADGDRDLYDYRRMQQCRGQVQGSSGNLTNQWYRAECGCADLNNDGVVDGHDLKLFQLIYTGPVSD